MKVAVINYSGNVGKSTIAQHLLIPRMADANLIPVESINSYDSEEEAIKGAEFGALQEALDFMDDVVVDIGTSNVEVFMMLMGQFRRSHEAFDYFVVPTISVEKQQIDTITTIEALSKLGVPAKKIRLVFNLVDDGCNVGEEFLSLFDYYNDQKKFFLNPEAIIHKSEVFERMKGQKESLQDILANLDAITDAVSAEKDKDKKMELIKKRSIGRLAEGVSEEMDAVFKTLFK